MTIFSGPFNLFEPCPWFFLCVCVYVHIASAENFAQVSYLSKEVKKKQQQQQQQKVKFLGKKLPNNSRG